MRSTTCAIAIAILGLVSPVAALSLPLRARGAQASRVACKSVAACRAAAAALKSRAACKSVGAGRAAAAALTLRGGSVEPELKLQLAGKLLPGLKETVLDGERVGLALERVFDRAFAGDLLVIGALWFLTVPIFKMTATLQNFILRKLKKEEHPYKTTLSSALAVSFRGLARLLVGLYSFDIGLLALESLQLPIRADLPKLLMSFTLPLWAAYMLSNIKAQRLGVLPSQLEVTGTGKMGRKMVINRLADFFLVVCGAFVGLDLISLEMGVALSSLLAVGGVSSVVVALACQEPLSHLVYGLLVVVEDKFRPGDEVVVGDTAGFIQEVGWFSTYIKKYDQSTIVIPNGKVMGQPIINLSRATWGQYRVDFRINTEDMDKMPAVVDAIRKALYDTPGMILPPEKGIAVNWWKWEKDALIVRVDAKLREPIGTGSYYDLREKVNIRVGEAVKATGAGFALPTSRRI